MGPELHEWRKYLTPISSVKVSPPEWIVPGLLVPGMNLISGEAKTFKSRLIMHMVAAVTELVPFGVGGKKAKAKQKGTAVYFAAEQSKGRVRFHYENHILKRRLKEGKSNLNFLLVNEPFEWQIDEPQGDKNILELMKDLKPTLTILDPLVNFHSIDENDPRLIRPLVPLRSACLKWGGALLVVHHANKGSAGPNGKKTMDFSRVRGTSALWAMADAGLLTNKQNSGTVTITTDFKDHAGGTWSWRPGQ